MKKRFLFLPNSQRDTINMMNMECLIDFLLHHERNSPSPDSTENGIGELLHVRQNGVNVRSDVFSINEDRSVLAIPQSHVQNGPVLREIDLLAVEHGVARVLHLSRSRQAEEELERLGIDAVLRVVEQDVAILGCRNFQTAKN